MFYNELWLLKNGILGNEMSPSTINTHCWLLFLQNQNNSGQKQPWEVNSAKLLLKASFICNKKTEAMYNDYAGT